MARRENFGVARRRCARSRRPHRSAHPPPLTPRSSRVNHSLLQDAAALVKQAVSIIDSAVSKGILKRRTASRYVSRLATRTPPSA